MDITVVPNDGTDTLEIIAVLPNIVEPTNVDIEVLGTVNVLVIITFDNVLLIIPNVLPNKVE
jgi:hypothetical protein